MFWYNYSISKNLRLLKPNISQDNPQSYLSVTYDK